MSPDELRQYLDVVRTCGVQFTRLELPGKLVLVGAEETQPRAAAPLGEHPIVGELNELGVDVKAMTSTLERLKAPT